jgi:hypothetical protein
MKRKQTPYVAVSMLLIKNAVFLVALVFKEPKLSMHICALHLKVKLKSRSPFEYT